MSGDETPSPSDIIETEIVRADLRTNPGDGLATVGGVLLGLVPGGGAAEKLWGIFRKGRAERHEAFAVEIARINGQFFNTLTDDLERLKETTRPAMLLDAINQAGAAQTQQRLQYLAKTIVEGMQASNEEAAEAQLVLKTLGSVSDEQIIILYSRVFFSPTTHEQQEFMALFPSIGFPDRDQIDAPDWKTSIVILSERIRGLENAGLAQSQLHSIPSPDNKFVSTLKMAQFTELAPWFLERIGLADHPPMPLNPVPRYQVIVNPSSDPN